MFIGLQAIQPTFHSKSSGGVCQRAGLAVIWPSPPTTGCGKRRLDRGQIPARSRSRRVIRNRGEIALDAKKRIAYPRPLLTVPGTWKTGEPSGRSNSAAPVGRDKENNPRGWVCIWELAKRPVSADREAFHHQHGRGWHASDTLRRPPTRPNRPLRPNAVQSLPEKFAVLRPPGTRTFRGPFFARGEARTIAAASPPAQLAAYVQYPPYRFVYFGFAGCGA